MVDDVHALYEKQGRAYVVKTQQPVRMLGGLDKGGTFRACYEAEGPPDYLLTVPGGHSIVLEVKRTQQHRWGFQLLQYHQAAQLERAYRLGAVAAVLVHFAKESRSALVLWEHLRGWWFPWNIGSPGARASLTYQEAADVAAWHGPGADYLSTLLVAVGSRAA
jgi:penicillin-binding protein-related factor A (putative recombinase)